MARIRVTIGWVLLGLAGVALAVGITMAATSVTSQRVGLESEPLSAGRELVPATARTATPEAPAARTTPSRTTRTGATSPPAATSPAATPVVPPVADDDASGDDDGGKGRGRGRGGDDDEDDDD